MAVPPPDPRLARQKRRLVALALLLLMGAGAVLFLLPRVPRPMRLAMGYTDLIAAATLLVVVRQKFPRG